MKVKIRVIETDKRIEVSCSQVFKLKTGQTKPNCFSLGATREDVIEWEKERLLKELTQEFFGEVREMLFDCCNRFSKSVINQEEYDKTKELLDKILTALSFEEADGEDEAESVYIASVPYVTIPAEEYEKLKQAQQRLDNGYRVNFKDAVRKFTVSPADPFFKQANATLVPDV